MWRRRGYTTHIPVTHVCPGGAGGALQARASSTAAHLTSPHVIVLLLRRRELVLLRQGGEHRARLQVCTRVLALIHPPHALSPALVHLSLSSGDMAVLEWARNTRSSNQLDAFDPGAQVEYRATQAPSFTRL